MTHPFPIHANLHAMEYLNFISDRGVAHNGIIRLTSDPTDQDYSDTAHFVAEFLAYLIRSDEDMVNPDIISAIERLAPDSRFAFMDGAGNISTAGRWTNVRGLLFSNIHWLQTPTYTRLSGY